MTLKNTENVVNAVKYAVRTRQDWREFMTENQIDRDGIKDAARQIAALAFPKDEPVQKVDGKRTRFGNAVQAAAYMMRAVLAEDETEAEETTPDYLAALVKAAEKAAEHGIDVMAALDTAGYTLDLSGDPESE